MPLAQPLPLLMPASAPAERQTLFKARGLESRELMSKGKEIKFKVGRATQSGDVRLSSYLPQVLTLSVSYNGERAATVVLTDEQVRQLRQALDELAPSIEARTAEGLRLAA